MQTTIKGAIVPGIDVPNNAGTWNSGMHFMQTSRRGIALKRKNIPSWFYDEKKVLTFLKRRFPKLRTDPKQKHRAGIWYVLIQEWFVQAYSETQIIKRNPTLGFTDRRQVSRQVQMIRFAVKGLRLDGREHTGRPKGRPIKERRSLIRASLKSS